MSQMSVGIVGGGIIGLAYATVAADRGHRVTLFERDRTAIGASVRNFGMLWPIGQALTPSQGTAIRSLARWRRLAAETDLWLHRCGSLHVAHEDDELEVLRQFQTAASSAGIECRLLEPAEVLELSPIVNPSGLRGGLASPSEAGVDPRRSVAAIASHLAGRRDVAIHFATGVTEVAAGRLRTTDGRIHGFDRIVVCGGSDVESLYPGMLVYQGIRRCKLQMMATPPHPVRIGPFLAGGLTLRHYANFSDCPALDTVKSRIAARHPELDRFGIHVMIAQNRDGSLILGDSHEYDERIGPFDKADIDDLILRELRRIARLPAWTITERWHGVYGKHPSLPIVRTEPESGVCVRVGTGGAGMTMSFGFAEEDWDAWDG